ncbi:MAG: hypothetical protein LAP40_03810 [Acidobacteriia bacterium]|nr:hypothetical protein [Terriglobia bacterium]
MKQIVLIIGALIAGFVGGLLGGRVDRGSDQDLPQQVIRARSFELVDESGTAISYWGIDKRKYAVLAFGSYWPVGAPDAPAGKHPADLSDPRNQRGAFGVIDDSPFVDLRAADGQTRMRLNLSIYQKPLLWMGDENGKRLALGVEHSDTPGAQDNDWMLRFAPDRAWIGMVAEKKEGQTYIQGALSVNTNKLKYP